METTLSAEKVHTSVSMKRIFKTWWPLAASWLIMSLEGPLMSAIVARLVDPKINLAAYGGVVFPISLVIESPIIMLLSASTAMSKDYPSYLKLRKVMHILGATFTILHALVAFTPLYFFVVNNILGVPPELVGPARPGLMIMLPWTWTIAYRRFNQGVMIRFGHSDGVMKCTIVRLTTITGLLFAGYFIGSIQGVIVATTAQAIGVTFEALYSGWHLRNIVKYEVKRVPPSTLFTWREFNVFYTPLVFTTLLQFLGNPIGSAALSRMPQAIDSLAVWGVVLSLVFLTRSFGNGLNEVVLALMDEKGSFLNLEKFTRILAGIITAAVAILFLTPFSQVWFEKVTGLSLPLSQLARNALPFFLLVPALGVFQSWFQGSILFGRKTRSITESVAIYLGVYVAILSLGVAWGNITGLYVGAVGFGIASIAQTGWLLVRSRHIRNQVRERDERLEESAP